MDPDEYILDLPLIRQFIAHVRQTLAELSPRAAVERLRPAFADLLNDSSWLPANFRRVGNVGEKGQIASWLLFRSGTRDLVLFSLCIPPGVASPIHDHQTWGLVGLYQGSQDEEVFEFEGEGRPLRLVTRRSLRVGEFYPLLPPEEDIHRVSTTSAGTSISLHLLGRDVGCAVRRIYLPNGSTMPFRSGWYNRPCDPGRTPPPTRPG